MSRFGDLQERVEKLEGALFGTKPWTSSFTGYTFNGTPGIQKRQDELFRLINDVAELSGMKVEYINPGERLFRLTPTEDSEKADD